MSEGGKSLLLGDGLRALSRMAQAGIGVGLNLRVGVPSLTASGSDRR
jgi:hypothetical protein